MSVSNKIREKNRFLIARRKVNEVIRSIEKSNSSLSLVGNRVKEAYLIDEVSGDNNYLIKLETSQKKLIQYIRTTILSNIDYEIRKLEEEIEELLNDD